MKVIARMMAIAALVLLAGSWSAAAQNLRADPSILAQNNLQRGGVAPQPEPEPEAEPDEPEAEPDPEPEPEVAPPQRQRPPPAIRRVGPPTQQAPPARNRGLAGPAAPPARNMMPTGPAAARPVRAASPAMTAGDVNGIPPLDELIATRERPLFSSTRRPPPPVEEVEPTQITEAKSLSFELVGIVRSAEQAFAILRNTESKEETRVPKGEKFGSWTIEDIGDRAIVLSGDTKRVRMRLFDEGKAPGISIHRVGGETPAAAGDDDAVDEEVEPSSSPEGRPATAQPVRPRVKGQNSNQNMSPAQRRKARLQQRQRKIEE